MFRNLHTRAIKNCINCKYMVANGSCKKFDMMASHARLSPTYCGLDANGYSEINNNNRHKIGESFTLNGFPPMFQMYTQTILIATGTYLLIL